MIVASVPTEVPSSDDAGDAVLDEIDAASTEAPESITVAVLELDDETDAESTEAPESVVDGVVDEAPVTSAPSD